MPVWPENYFRLLLGLGLAGLGLFWLSQLPQLASPIESQVLILTEHFPDSSQHFLGLPYYLVVWLGQLVISDGLLVARLVSLAGGLISLGLIWLILRHYYNPWLSYFGLLLVASNSWFVSLVLTAGPASWLMLTTLMLIWLVLTNHRWRNYYLAVAGGMAWFGALLSWLAVTGGIYLAGQAKSRWVGVSLLLGLGLTLWIDWLRPPFEIGHILTDWQFELFGQQVKELVVSLIWQAPNQPEVWLGTLPLLDMLGLAMLPFGIYGIWQRLRPHQIGWAAIFGIIVVSLAGLTGGILGIGAPVMIILTLLIVGAGLVEFSRLWLQTFPANPLARWGGLTILVGVVGLSVFYHTTRYFRAWQPPVADQPTVVTLSIVTPQSPVLWYSQD